MSWSDEKTLNFLRMYKDRSLLWDPADLGYKNKNKRHELLMELAVNFDIDKSDVERKIRSLQSQFARERKKERIITASKGDEPYVSKWFAYQSMVFLVDKHKPKTTTSDTDTKVAVKEVLNEVADSKANLQKQDATETKVRRLSKRFRKDSRNFPQKSMIIKRKQRSHTTAKMPVLDEALNLMRSIETKMEDKDEYTLYGEQVAVKLRKIPSPHARFAVQNIINKALFDAEMGYYSHNYPSTSCGNTSACTENINDINDICNVIIGDR